MNSVTCSNEPIVPSKIVCIGRNYSEHIEELGNATPKRMVVFIKPNSSISETLTSYHGEQVHYEAEICFLVKKEELFAVGVGIDLTKRALQKELREEGLPWERAKSFEGAATFSEFIPIEDAQEVFALKLEINGRMVQRSDSTHMIHQPAEILSEVKTFLPLCDGDIIMTGTPAGVGPIVAGAEFSASIIHDEKLIVNKVWTAA